MSNNKCAPGGTSTAIMRALNVFKHWVSKYPQVRYYMSMTSMVCTVMCGYYAIDYSLLIYV